MVGHTRLISDMITMYTAGNFLLKRPQDTRFEDPI